MRGESTAAEREQALARMLGQMTDAELDRFIEAVFADLITYHQQA